ncbi:unnamed protein product, partial [Candidula unifasciata]
LQRQPDKHAPRNSSRSHMKGPSNKNISLHELLERHSGKVYPPPPRDTTSRLPEFVPDGPRPFIPDPSFMPSDTNIEVHQGDLAILPCTVQNLGTRQ